MKIFPIFFLSTHENILFSFAPAQVEKEFITDEKWQTFFPKKIIDKNRTFEPSTFEPSTCAGKVTFYQDMKFVEEYRRCPSMHEIAIDNCEVFDGDK